MPFAALFVGAPSCLDCVRDRRISGRTSEGAAIRHRGYSDSRPFGERAPYTEISLIGCPYRDPWARSHSRHPTRLSSSRLPATGTCGMKGDVEHALA
jgi:hypothetical protein